MPFKRCLLTTCLIQCWWESSWPPDQGIRDERSKWKVFLYSVKETLEEQFIEFHLGRDEIWSALHHANVVTFQPEDSLVKWHDLMNNVKIMVIVTIRWFYLRAKPKSTSLRVKPFLGKRSTSTASSPLSCWWCSKHLPVFTENVLRLDVEMDNVPCVQVLNSWMVTVVKPPPLPALTFGKKKQHKDEKILKPDKICPTKPATSLSVRSCSSGFRY